MMTYSICGAASPMYLSGPIEIELEPIYQTVPAHPKRRSDGERQCAALMLEKLRRGEDVAPTNLHEASAYEADKVLDVVIDRLIDRL